MTQGNLALPKIRYSKGSTNKEAAYNWYQIFISETNDKNQWQSGINRGNETPIGGKH